MGAGRVDFCGDGHGCWGEVLDLFETEAEVFGFEGEFGHVFRAGAWVRADEVGDDWSVAFAGLGGSGGEFLAELVEEVEGRFAHDAQDVVAGVFGGDFEASGDVVSGEGFDVFLVAFLDLRGGAFFVEEEIVADAAGDEGVFDALGVADGFVDFEERGVVGVEIAADVWPDAGGADAFVADPLLFALHLVHVSGGAAEVADGAAEVGHLFDGFDFFEDGGFGARGDELALVGGDGAEAAAAEAAAVHVDGMADHFVGRDGPTLPVFGVREASVGQIEGGVDLAFGHDWEGRVDDEETVAGLLEDAACFDAIGFGLDVFEVLRVEFAVGEAFLVGEESAVVPVFVFRGRGAGGEEDGGLRDGGEGGEGDTALEEADAFLEGEFAHAVDEEVGAAIGEDGGFEFVRPVVEVSDAAETGFDAADHDGDVREEVFEDVGVDGGGVVGAEAVIAAGGVGVFAAAFSGSGVVIDHGVHAAGGDAEEEPWGAEFFEVAEVVAPIGLGDDGDLEAFGFEETADDGGAEGRVVDVGVAGDDDDIEFVPAACEDFVAGGGEPACWVPEGISGAGGGGVGWSGHAGE